MQLLHWQRYRGGTSNAEGRTCGVMGAPQSGMAHFSSLSVTAFSLILLSTYLHSQRQSNVCRSCKVLTQRNRPCKAIGAVAVVAVQRYAAVDRALVPAHRALELQTTTVKQCHEPHEGVSSTACVIARSTRTNLPFARSASSSSASLCAKAASSASFTAWAHESL